MKRKFPDVLEIVERCASVITNLYYDFADKTESRMHDFLSENEILQGTKSGLSLKKNRRLKIALTRHTHNLLKNQKLIEAKDIRRKSRDKGYEGGALNPNSKTKHKAQTARVNFKGMTVKSTRKHIKSAGYWFRLYSLHSNPFQRL